MIPCCRFKIVPLFLGRCKNPADPKPEPESEPDVPAITAVQLDKTNAEAAAVISIVSSIRASLSVAQNEKAEALTVTVSSTADAAKSAALSGNNSGTGAAFNIRRITGAGDDLHPAGEWTDKIAWSGMQLSAAGPALENTANGKDGADCVQKPEQAVYETMGWDFGSVWITGGGYPALRRQY
ncbi:MAG: hypothetical protein LBD18_03910 [Treponema sp.]|jgi:hypothetical protein|nr:hypothetical protein [Treponema sp.]